MAQTNLTIRIDEDVKQEAEKLFNRIGLNMSSAINVFFRQSIREQSIPFELKPYDDYNAGEDLARIRRSVRQSGESKIIIFTVDELMVMEEGEILQRAKDFLERNKGDIVKGSSKRTREEILARGKEAMREAREQAIINGTSEMTLDEINEIISECRKERIGA